jgi:tRNA (guanine-N7-)-methyltransferase
MGKNKLQKFSDMSEWPHVFECAGHEDRLVDHPFKGQWNRSVFRNDNPLVLELGCGKGEYTVALAELYPHKNVIGIDIKGARMWTGAKAIQDKGLTNAVFLRTHIEYLSRFFAPGEVAEIWLTFPDPQMKKVRKRLTSTRFMQDYQRMLSPEGLIHLKTDSAFMYQYTREMIMLNELIVVHDTDDLYHCGWNDPLLAIKTFYETQWLMRGLTIKYLQFRLPDVVDWKEPDTEITPDPYRSFGRSARLAPATDTPSSH